MKISKNVTLIKLVDSENLAFRSHNNDYSDFHFKWLGITAAANFYYVFKYDMGIQKSEVYRGWNVSAFL